MFSSLYIIEEEEEEEEKEEEEDIFNMYVVYINSHRHKYLMIKIPNGSF